MSTAAENMARVEGRGMWINPEGFALRPLFCQFWPWPNQVSLYRKTIWEYQSSISEPLTYRSRAGFYYQPDRHRAQTDLGSIPPPFRNLFPHDEFVRSYVLHDSLCKDKGAFMAYAAGGPFAMQKLLSRWVHDLLREMVIAENGSPRRATLIWAMVSIFGPKW